jgi:hypothetical protein
MRSSARAQLFSMEQVADAILEHDVHREFRAQALFLARDREGARLNSEEVLMHKTLISAAFGAATLAAASFGSAPVASAADVDFYLGTPGVTVGFGHNACRDYWYRRNHPYRCGYYHYRSAYPYYPGYYGRDGLCYRRWYREEHPYRCRWYYRRYDY